MGNRFRLGLTLLALVLALATTPAAGYGAPYVPSGWTYPAIDPDEIPGRPGTVVWSGTAGAQATLPAAERVKAIVHRSRSILGEQIVVTGTIAIPKGHAPRGGWPVVSWAHVTTGGADSCAPSTADPSNPEWERLTRGDDLVNLLLSRGMAVARTDYEGVGGTGPHPYLIGKSLARSQAEIVVAARSVEPTLGRRWAAAGHSEGGVSSIFAAEYASRFAPGLELVGVSSIAPPIGTRLLLDVARQVPVAVDGAGGLTALAALIVGGALASDPILAAQAADGALSPRALELLEHVESRCFNELSMPDSWGGLAPNAIVGPRFREAADRFYSILDANDPVAAKLGSTPVRLDQGLLDVVASDPAARWFILRQRLRGARITYRLHPLGTHMNITDMEFAAPGVAQWLDARFG